MASPTRPVPILVMASGNGSNFQALIDAVSPSTATSPSTPSSNPLIPNARITRLITNRSKAHATARADTASIPWEYFNLISHGFLAKGEKDDARVAAAREAYDAALAAKVLALEEGVRPELIVLAGWMYVFSAKFLEPVTRAGIRVINLHPALPGAYDGAGAIERAYSDFQAGKATKTGIMVHYVIETVDRGEPIMVREIEWRGEELSQLEARMHSHEHELLVEATAKVVAEIVASTR